MDKKAQTKIIISILAFLLIVGGIAIAYTNPTITLESPASGTWLTSGSNVEFNLSGTTTTKIYANYTLFIDGVANTTAGNNTGLLHLNGTETNLTVASMEDGTYVWNVQLKNKTYDAQNSEVIFWASDNYTVYIDSTAPVVGNLSPADELYTTADSLTVSAQCNDTNPNEMELWVNGVINKTATYNNATRYTFAGVNGFANGNNVSWTVACTDDAGNRGWATNRSQYMDLVDPVVGSNVTNMTWFKIGQNVGFNVTYTSNLYPDTCTLYGNFNRTAGVASPTFEANQSLTNQSGILGVGIATNFSWLTVVDTNDTGMYQWNVLCNSSGGRSTWLSPNYNLTAGVDTVAPSSPDLLYISTEYYTNSTGSVRRWRNMTRFLTTSDYTPYIVYQEVTDVNDVTLSITFSTASGLTTTPRITTVSGTVSGGAMTIDNNTQISLPMNKSEDYTDWYYVINVTDDAGNWNTSFTNKSAQAYSQLYRVFPWGVNLTASIWNPITVIREGMVDLESIVNETGASYVAIYNRSHEFVTCSSAALTSDACDMNVSQGNPVWIYRSTAGSWDYSWFNATKELNPLMNSANIDYGYAGRSLNLTANVSSDAGSRYNYIGILNWSDGCTYGNIQSLMNGSLFVGLGATSATNVNNTGQGNITFMSYLNISDSTYYPYYWEFGTPWSNTKLEFRGVAAVYLNETYNAMYNRSGC